MYLNHFVSEFLTQVFHAYPLKIHIKIIDHFQSWKFNSKPLKLVYELDFHLFDKKNCSFSPSDLFL
ncbi:unknown; predicted coding region [Mycoplasmopsis pulmonis]|uniref:Uncharacterized protein n=1 Tax=Mycoplasmopsis pulmonis (strain UAB CTIP) TaxID=272635 RepID=Q98PX7_MYCPU|nr:unknown; predicted coding region [Mycoplasmopsis pulmonis]